MAKTNKVIIVESSPVVAAGMAALLSESGSCTVVDVCPDMEVAMEKVIARPPRILILDPNVLDFSQRLMLRRLFQDYPHLLLVALQTGFVEQAVLNQFHAVIGLDDNLFRMESKLQSLLTRQQEEPNAGVGPCELSERELEVLKALARGDTGKQVADALNISVHTVVTHRKNISKKTGIKTVSGLALYAMLNHLIDGNEIR